MLDVVVVASYMDADEKYHSRVFTPVGGFAVTSGSIGLMAYAVEEQIKGLTPDARIAWHWFGLIADDSAEHLTQLIAEAA